MKAIIGYSIDDKHIRGYHTSIRSMEANVKFLEKLVNLGGSDLFKEYVRLHSRGRLRDYSLNINKLPSSCRRVIYLEDGKVQVDNVEWRREVIEENDPINDLSPEEREILRRFKSGK